jgi:hypothetical protein
MALAFDAGRSQPATTAKKSKSIEYRVIFGVAFVVFFAAALIESVLPKNFAARLQSNCKRKTAFQRAKDSANTCAAYAFMG